MKPITFILIGILIGASVGVGAAYFFILPNLVKPQMEELSQRLSEVESSIGLLAEIQSRAEDRLSGVEETIKSIGPLANRVSAIEGSIQRLDNLSQSISSIEGSLFSIESDMKKINAQLLNFQESLNDLYYSDIPNLQNDIVYLGNGIASLENNITKLISEVDKIVLRLEKDLAYKLLKKTLAEPSEDIVTQITDEIFNELKASNNKFIQWINLAGSEHVKNVLGGVIDSQFPTLVWNDQYIDKIKTNKYMIYVITYFPLTIDTGLPSIGEIKVSRVSLIIMGIVNVSKENVSSIEAYSLNL